MTAKEGRATDIYIFNVYPTGGAHSGRPEWKSAFIGGACSQPALTGKSVNLR